MADAIRFVVPDNDFIELTGAGADGSINHQGGVAESNSVLFVEAAVKPAFDINNPDRFKDGAISMNLKSGELEDYYSAIAIWAVSSGGDQIITVTPK